METPGSNVRMTRSRARQLTPYNGKPPVTPAAASTRKLDRLPLGELTNDSPIAGVVPDIQKGNTVMPRGAKANRRVSVLPSTKTQDPTQDSCIEGEELLRAQVKLLLEKQANKGLEQVSALGSHPLLNMELSPMPVLVGPTPANTPALAGGKEVQQEMTTEEANGLLEKLATPGAVPYEEVCRLLEALEKPPPAEATHVVVEEKSVVAELEDEPNASTPIVIAMPVIENRVDVPEPEMNLPVTRALCFDSYEVESDPVSQVAEHTPTVRSVVVIPSPGSERSAGSSEMVVDNTFNAGQSVAHNETPEEDSGSEAGSPISSIASLSESINMAPKSPASTWSVGVNVGSPTTNDASGPHMAVDESPCAHSHGISSVYTYQSHPTTPASVTKSSGIWERCKPTVNDSDDENSGWATVEEEETDDGEFSSQLECDELIAQMNTMGIAPLRGLPCATGTHIRFVDDGNGELKEEMEVLGPDNGSMAAAALKLRGLPTPKGKHIRFDDELSE